MTPSPRSFSTISVAVIVLSATLSVLLSPDRSFAQSTADVTTVSLISPHPLMTPNITTKIACTQQQERNCRNVAQNRCGSRGEAPMAQNACYRDIFASCMKSCGG